MDLTLGDLVPIGSSITWEDTPDYTITITRISDTQAQIDTIYKNIETLLAVNAEQANNFSKTGKLGDTVKAASIPTGIYYQWQKEGITDDPEAMKRRLNDPTYSKFRTNGLVL